MSTTDKPLTEKEITGRKYADKLIAWFASQELPATLYVAAHMNITDLPACVASLTAALNGSRPYTRPFLAMYDNLLTIKKKLSEK